MAVFIGGLLILWGGLVLYSSLFKARQEEDKGKEVFGVSGYIELEFLFRLLSRLPSRVIKGFTFLIGLSFVTVGTVIII